MGNPQNPVGHKTAYLWERVWQRDAWLDLLARFVHVEKPKSKKERGYKKYFFHIIYTSERGFSLHEI